MNPAVNLNVVVVRDHSHGNSRQLHYICYLCTDVTSCVPLGRTINYQTFFLHPLMESDLPPPWPVGNHRLATQIAYDSTLSIYRSFTILNTLNLLYLQTELASLEDRLLRLDNRASDLNEWSLPRS